MKEKKNSVITFRTEEWVKEGLEIAAEQNKWSVAQTVNELCKKFVINPQAHKITIKTQDLIKAIEEIKKEGQYGAIEISIELTTNKEETEVIKMIELNVLECGGMGRISGFDPIYEITKEELNQIP